jgi:N-acetylglutamate synthase-like GNAT family acetyltransferase
LIPRAASIPSTDPRRVLPRSSSLEGKPQFVPEGTVNPTQPIATDDHEAAFLATPAPDAVRRMRIRSALPPDAPRIAHLVNTWADQSVMLHVSHEDVLQRLGEFVVAFDELDEAAGILACGALSVFSPTLAEIRSIAVAPACQGHGVGSMVVRFLMENAAALEIDRLILLTKKPGFFARLGFYEIPERMMPEQFKHEAILGKNRTTTNKSIMMYQFLA